MDAATHNTSLLEEVGYDLRKFIEMHPLSTISYGSKIRPLEQLTPLLQHHPTLEHLAKNLQHGIDHPLTFERFSFTENLQNGIDYPLNYISENPRKAEPTVRRK